MSKSASNESLSDHGPTRRHSGIRIVLWSIIFAILALGLVVLGFASTQLERKSAPPVNRVSALPVATLRIEPQQTYQIKRTFIGRVEAAQESGIGFELAGLLRDVLVEEGDMVETGQLLARLDGQRLQAQRNELLAALKQAEANLALAEITVKRFEGVVKVGGVTAQALDEARENRRATQAAVGMARSRIETIEVELQKSDLRAPFAALVTRRFMDQGRVLAAGEPVLGLQQRGPREARVGIAGRLIDAVAVGQVHPVRVNGKCKAVCALPAGPATDQAHPPQANEHSFPARIRAILPVRNAGTRTVDVILKLGKGSEDLRSGELARLELAETLSEEGYWLPLGALAEGARGLWTSYAAEPLALEAKETSPIAATHKLVPRAVEILHEESDRVFARGTLRRGDLIVSAGLHRVVPGQLVRLSPNSGLTPAN